MPGTLGQLYVVATPIGNLEDMTFRAKRILGEVNLIAAEDTRRTGKLLSHFEIRTPMTSLREHNEVREAPRLVARMLAGESIALVTDAGTPGIADPGARLVRAAREAGIKVSPVPGPSAVAAAMSVSGAESSEFLFLGFPPPKGTVRKEWFERLQEARETVVFFEAPHRIERTLSECSGVLAKRHILCLRELTKLHETEVKWPNIEDGLPINAIGEFVVVVEAEIGNPPGTGSDQFDPASAFDLFQDLVAGGRISEDLAIELVSLKLSASLADVKKAVKKAKILVKRQNQ
jgi:16S rRNA (cytidine1402-2'-O)-methyltransferase